MKILIQCLAVGAAGALGALARFGVARLFGRLPIQFPVGTFVINITGSFFLGWFSTVVQDRYPIPETLRLAIATGFVGAFTTFSTWMYESADLARKGAGLESAANLLGSLLVGLAAVWLGMVVGRKV
jgi:CrcB protein